MDSSSRALELKEEGNKCFQSGDFVGADALYSKAIIIDATNPLLYTNRAMARLKLCLYLSVIPDCEASLKLLPETMKPYYYLAQAEIELGQLEDAYSNAQTAYEICAGIKTGVVDKQSERSLAAVTTLVLRCKKELWEKKESERLKTRNALSEDLSRLLLRDKDEQLVKLEEGGEHYAKEKAKVERDWAEKDEELKRVWESAAAADSKRREVPDWLIDNITFAVMHDPVITKTGQSYERASILEHLRRSPTDPLTRESLRVDELRPNLGLKAACAEFIEQNGWAVDW